MAAAEDEGDVSRPLQSSGESEGLSLSSSSASSSWGSLLLLAEWEAEARRVGGTPAGRSSRQPLPAGVATPRTPAGRRAGRAAFVAGSVNLSPRREPLPTASPARDILLPRLPATALAAIVPLLPPPTRAALRATCSGLRRLVDEHTRALRLRPDRGTADSLARRGLKAYDLFPALRCARVALSGTLTLSGWLVVSGTAQCLTELSLQVPDVALLEDLALSVTHPNLKRLELLITRSGNPHATPPAVQFMAGVLSGLTHLRIAWAGADPASPAAAAASLAHGPRRLFLDGRPRLGPLLLSALPDLQHLDSLELEGFLIDAEGHEVLARAWPGLAPRLRRLVLSRLHLMISTGTPQEQHLGSLAGSCPALRHLHLDVWMPSAAQGPGGAAALLFSLLYAARDVEAAALQALPVSLTRLSLPGVALTSPDDLRALGRLSALTCLEVAALGPGAAEFCPALQELRLLDCCWRQVLAMLPWERPGRRGAGGPQGQAGGEAPLEPSPQPSPPAGAPPAPGAAAQTGGGAAGGAPAPAAAAPPAPGPAAAGPSGGAACSSAGPLRRRALSCSGSESGGSDSGSGSGSGSGGSDGGSDGGSESGAGTPTSPSPPTPGGAWDTGCACGEHQLGPSAGGARGACGGGAAGPQREAGEQGRSGGQGVPTSEQQPLAAGAEGGQQGAAGSSCGPGPSGCGQGAAGGAGSSGSAPAAEGAAGDGQPHAPPGPGGAQQGVEAAAREQQGAGQEAAGPEPAGAAPSRRPAAPRGPRPTPAAIAEGAAAAVAAAAAALSAAPPASPEAGAGAPARAAAGGPRSGGCPHSALGRGGLRALEVVVVERLDDWHAPDRTLLGRVARGLLPLVEAGCALRLKVSPDAHPHIWNESDVDGRPWEPAAVWRGIREAQSRTRLQAETAALVERLARGRALQAERRRRKEFTFVDR